MEGVLQSGLGYSGEMAIRASQGLIFDPEFDDFLPEKLSSLNIKDQAFITITDEDDEDKDPRIDLELLVVQR